MGDLLLFKEEHPELVLQCNRLVEIFKRISSYDTYLGVVRVNDVVYVTWHYGFYTKYLLFKSVCDGVYLYKGQDRSQVCDLISDINQVQDAIKWLQSY